MVQRVTSSFLCPLKNHLLPQSLVSSLKVAPSTHQAAKEECQGVGKAGQGSGWSGGMQTGEEDRFRGTGS